MLTCRVCGKELKAVREVSKLESDHELVDDPIMGWIVGPLTGYRTIPQDRDLFECGCGRWVWRLLAGKIENGWVIETRDRPHA